MSWNKDQIKETYISCYPQIASLPVKYKYFAIESKELFHEALFHYLENILKGRYKETAHVCTYLYQIAKNYILNEIRKNRGRISGDDMLSFVSETVSTEIPDITEEEAENMNRKFKLSKCVEKLNPKFQQMVAYISDGKRNEEMCKLLDYSTEDAFRVAKTRCMNQLKECVKNIK